MYIKPTRQWYEAGGTQHAGQQWFLIMCVPGKKTKDVLSGYESYLADYDYAGRHPIRCIVRKVALEQLGHWMMGYARAFGHRITISGSYGSDGLPKNVDREVWDKAIPLPDDLYDAWNKGGGHNSCGSEAPTYANGPWIISRYWHLKERYCNGQQISAIP